MQINNKEVEARNGMPLPTYQPLFGVVAPEPTKPNNQPAAEKTPAQAKLDILSIEDDIEALRSSELLSEQKALNQILEAYQAEQQAVSSEKSAVKTEKKKETSEKVFVNPALPTLAEEPEPQLEAEKVDPRDDLLNLEEIDPSTLTEAEIISEIKKISEIAFKGDILSDAEKDLLKVIVDELDALPPAESEPETTAPSEPSLVTENLNSSTTTEPVVVKQQEDTVESQSEDFEIDTNDLKTQHSRILAEFEADNQKTDLEFVLGKVFPAEYFANISPAVRQSVEQKLVDATLVTNLVTDAGKQVAVRQLNQHDFATLTAEERKYALLQYSLEYLNALKALQEAATIPDSQLLNTLEFACTSNLGRLDDTYNRFKGTESQFYKDLYMQNKMFIYIEIAKLAEAGVALPVAEKLAFEQFEKSIIAGNPIYNAIDFNRDLELLLRNNEIYKEDTEFKIYLEAYQESLSLLRSLGGEAEVNYFDSLISNIYVAKLSSRQI